MDFVNFKKIIVDMLLDGENEILNILKKQYNYLIESDIIYTNCGFFINFIPDKEALKYKLGNYNIFFGDVAGDFDGTKQAFGFNIRVHDGVLSSIECFCDMMGCFKDRWHIDDYSKIHLYYTDIDEKRNIVESNKRNLIYLESIIRSQIK